MTTRTEFEQVHGHVEYNDLENTEDFFSRFSNLSMKDVQNVEGRNFNPRMSDLSMGSAMFPPKDCKTEKLNDEAYSRLSDLSMGSVGLCRNGTGFSTGSFARNFTGITYSTTGSTVTYSTTSTGFSTASSSAGVMNGNPRNSSGFATGNQLRFPPPKQVNGNTFNMGNTGANRQRPPNSFGNKSGAGFNRDLSNLAFSPNRPEQDFSTNADSRQFSDLSIDSVDFLRSSNLSQSSAFFRIRGDSALHESPNDIEEPPDNVEVPPNDYVENSSNRTEPVVANGQMPSFSNNRFVGQGFVNGNTPSMEQQFTFQPRATESQQNNNVGLQSNSVFDRNVVEPNTESGSKRSAKSETPSTTAECSKRIKVPKFIDSEIKKMNGAGEFKKTELMIMLFYVHYFFDQNDVYSRTSECMHKKRTRASIRHKIVKLVHKHTGHKGSILQDKSMTAEFRNIINVEFWDMVDSAETHGDAARKLFASRLRKFATQQKMTRQKAKTEN